MPVDGTLVHYRDEGSGTPVLLIHGAFSSLHTYDAWTQKLQKDYRVIRLTLPGFGLTGPLVDRDYDMPYLIGFIGTFLDQLNIDRCILVGHSLGGWISWEFAIKQPDRVEKLVLIAAAGFLDKGSIPMPFVWARTPLVNRIIRFAIKRNVLEQFVHQVYFDDQLITDQLIDRYYDLFTRPGNPEAFLKIANGRLKDRTAYLKRIECDTLIMWGRDDQWLPVANAERFRERIPNGRVIIYDEVGHVPMEEHSRKSVSDIRRFFKPAGVRRRRPGRRKVMKVSSNKE